MSTFQVRQFSRRDRDQLTTLVNAHAAAVIPGGMGASVATLLTSLERQPGEPITGAWVSERATLVAEQQHRVVAAAPLLRYYADERSGPSYRGLGEINRLVFWPEGPSGNPYWTDATRAAEALIAAGIGQFERWGVTGQGRTATCLSLGSTGCPSSGRMSGRSTGEPGSPRLGTQRSST